MKSSIFLCTLIIIVFTTSCVFAAQTSCTSDSACNYGLCTTSGNSSFCSCLSGFGGSSCEILPSSNCTARNVTSESTNFDPFVTLTYSYPSQVILDVMVDIEESIFESLTSSFPNNTAPYSLETIIYFGNGTFPECTFPNALWDDFAASSSDCMDRYRLNISFVDAVTKCGFDNLVENKTYEQTVTVDRKYLIMESRGYNATRTESRSFNLKIIFPDGANVSTPNVRVSYTASATPSISPSSSVPPLKTYSQVTMSISASLQDFSPAEFVNDIASILNITSDRITIVSISVSSKSVYKQNSIITVVFNIVDTPGSSAADLSATLVQLVQSGDPVLADFGLTVVGIAVDNSNAAGQASSESGGGDKDNVLLYAILFPLLAMVLAGLAIGTFLIVRRLRKKQPDWPGLPEAPSPDKSPGISPSPSYPSPPTPPEMIAIPTPPNKPRITMPQSYKYPADMNNTTRIKSRQVTLDLMAQLQQIRTQNTKLRSAATNNNNATKNNDNNNNNNSPGNNDNQPLSRPPSYNTGLGYSPENLPVQPSQVKKSQTQISRFSQASKKTTQSRPPPQEVKPESESDSDSSWIATPDSLTSDSDDYY